MNQKRIFYMALAGFSAGAVNGLFGAGGGMVLIPLMHLLLRDEDRTLFSASVAVILPICIISILLSPASGISGWTAALPWLPGSAAGGWCAAKWGEKIPVPWLHRGLGLLILYGGMRYLC